MSPENEEKKDCSEMRREGRKYRSKQENRPFRNGITSTNLLLDATWSLTLERSRKDWKVALKKRGSREPDSRPLISHLREPFNVTRNSCHDFEVLPAFATRKRHLTKIRFPPHSTATGSLVSASPASSRQRKSAE